MTVLESDDRRERQSTSICSRSTQQKVAVYVADDTAAVEDGKQIHVEVEAQESGADGVKDHTHLLGLA